MELILKPTELCNFKCTFCSSTDLTEEKANLLPLDKVFKFLKRFPETNTIIVNGGDPLMVKPQYYWDIINYLDGNNLKTTLSFTTNLWDFYIRPEKWEELFRHDRVGVSTSFNYGNTRLVSHKQVYTEELFWNVSNLFLERVGYRPDFISVITEENEDTALDNVKLAKKMGVECKLNYAMASGIQSRPYQLSKIYKLYLDIVSENLIDWEFNTKQMLKRFTGKNTICPQNRNCDESIRCLQPDGDYYSCGAFGDDKEYAIDFTDEVDNGNKTLALSQDIEINFMKDECLACPMFLICNGCKKTIKDLKVHNMVADHCKLMKELAPKIIELNHV